MSLQKNVKSHGFLDFEEKNEKQTYSRTSANIIAMQFPQL